jgi:hypothetical protein
VTDGAGVGAGIGHTGQAERGTAEDPGRHGGESDVAGEATRDGGVNFNPPVRVGFPCVRLVCSSRETTVPHRAGGCLTGEWPSNRLSCVSRDRGNRTCKVGARDAEALPGRGFGEGLGAVDRRYLNGARISAAVDRSSSDG